MTLQEKTQRLWDLRQKIDSITEKYNEATDPLKKERDAIQQELIVEMKLGGQFSARFSFATVTLAVRKTLSIIDENKVVAYLKKKKLAKEYTAIRLNENFEAMRKELAKQGQTIPGTELKETEYISLRESEKEEKRKVQTN